MVEGHFFPLPLKCNLTLFPADSYLGELKGHHVLGLAVLRAEKFSMHECMHVSVMWIWLGLGIQAFKSHPKQGAAKWHLVGLQHLQPAQCKWEEAAGKGFKNKMIRQSTLLAISLSLFLIGAQIQREASASL